MQNQHEQRKDGAIIAGGTKVESVVNGNLNGLRQTGETAIPLANGQRRQVKQEKKSGLTVSDILLVGILLAAGAVLKFFVGSFFSVGMKPNFIIAMYCLAILLIKPRLPYALIIGALAGVVCQFFPGTPYVNLVSEPIGALVMALLMHVPFLQLKRLNLRPVVATFLSTLASGFVFILLLYLAFYSGVNVEPMPLPVFLAIIFGTATINAIMVQILYLPLKLVMGGKNRA